MKQHASRYASATIPARAVLCDLPIDVFLGARPWRELRDDCEQVGNGGVFGRNRPYRHLDLAVVLCHRLIEIDVPATKPPPNDHSAVYATKVAGSGGRLLSRPECRWPRLGKPGRVPHVERRRSLERQGSRMQPQGRFRSSTRCHNLRQLRARFRRIRKVHLRPPDRPHARALLDGHPRRAATEYQQRREPLRSPTKWGGKWGGHPGEWGG